MNLLVVGSGKGSWDIRGLQLGTAMGARITSTPSADDWRWADAVILIKHAGPLWATTVHRYGKPLLWDALDFWRQPRDNNRCEAHARALLQQRLAAVQPTLFIGATKAMADAGGGIYLPHHAWPTLEPTPAHPMIQTVAYEGNPVYLGRWHAAVRAACDARGWTFVVNPPSLADVDLLVAFRDGVWDGWMCRHWKSGVKAVNAIVAGRPLISHPSAAVDELHPAGTVIDDVRQLDAALDEWGNASRRAAVVAAAMVRAPNFSCRVPADHYLALLTAFIAKEVTL